MENKPAFGVESEFNMDLKSKERVHNILDFLNRAPLDPAYAGYFTPEIAYRAWMAIFRETKCIMKQEERDLLYSLRDSLTGIYNNFIKLKHSQRSTMRVKAITLAAELNKGLDDFGMEIMDILQAHKYIYRAGMDIHKAVLNR